MSLRQASLLQTSHLQTLLQLPSNHPVHPPSDNPIPPDHPLDPPRPVALAALVPHNLESQVLHLLDQIQIRPMEVAETPEDLVIAS